jgi:hypothetical protein
VDNSGLPERPTPFEVRVREYGREDEIYAVLSEDGRTPIGYVSSRYGVTKSYDINGNIVDISEVPLEPSPVQPDDILFLGKFAVATVGKVVSERLLAAVGNYATSRAAAGLGVAASRRVTASGIAAGATNAGRAARLAVSDIQLIGGTEARGRVLDQVVNDIAAKAREVIPSLTTVVGGLLLT